MNVHQLLERIEARGGVAMVKRNHGGAVVLNVAPRSVALELLPEIQKFKPALLELLARDATTGTDDEGNVAEYVRTRSAGYWAMQRARAEIGRRWNNADRIQLARLLNKLDAGEEIE